MTSQPSGKPSPASADARRDRRPARWPSVGVLALAGAGLWGGPPALDALRAAEARVTGRPEIREACSFRLRTGLPCLGCGGTHALAAVARGDIRRGFAANPLGACVGVAAWALVGVALLSLLVGRSRPVWWTIGAVAAALPVAFVVTAVLWWQAVGRSAWDERSPAPKPTTLQVRAVASEKEATAP